MGRKLQKTSKAFQSRYSEVLGLVHEVNFENQFEKTDKI